MLLRVINKRRLLKIFIVLIILITVFVVLSLSLLNKKTFLKNIFVDDVNVSELSFEQARSLMQDTVSEKYTSKKIIIKYKDRVWEVMPSEISYKINIEQALENAYKIGRTGSIFKRVYQFIYLNFIKTVIEVTPDFNRHKLYNVLLDIKKQVDSRPQNATINKQKGAFIVNKEVLGKSLDIDINQELIEKRIIEKDFRNIELIVNDINTDITYNDIKDINNELGKFTTIFNMNNYNRSYNIDIACKKINNTIILPGEVFSMDKVLGARTIENGYREAPVIYKNEIISGIGGGICQVTTTLYGTVLLSKLEVLERTHHSIAPSYVELGQDATIAEGFIDFKFKNNSDYAISVFAETIENKIIISIFGKTESTDFIVKLKSEITEVYTTDEEDIIFDDSIPDYQKIVVNEAKQGFKVVVYRETFNKKGELLNSEKISEDIYQPVKAKVKVNHNYYDEIIQ